MNHTGIEHKLKTWSDLIRDASDFCLRLQADTDIPRPDSEYTSEHTQPWELQVDFASMMVRVSLIAARQCLIALQQLLDPDMSEFAFAPVVRAELENVARTYWLLEPGIGPQRRVERRMTIELDSLLRVADFRREWGRPENQDDWQSGIRELEELARGLGLAIHRLARKPVDRYVGETPYPGPTRTVKQLAVDIGLTMPAYGWLSGIAHAEFHAVQDGFQFTYDENRAMSIESEFRPDMCATAVLMAVGAFVAGSARFGQWRGADLEGVNDWPDKINRACRE